MKRLSLLFLLAACATPEPVFKPVPVDVPIPVACAATPIAKPDFALSHVIKSDGLADKTKAALIELDQRKAYEAALESQLTLCH